MKTKSLKFWICIILSAILATAIITNTLAEKTTVRPDKIEESLWEYMQTAKDDELIPINILLCDVDDNLILQKLEEQTGLDAELFQDDERFEKEFSYKSDNEILQLQQFFQSEKNKILRAEQTKQNNDFISAYVKNNDSVTFVNEYIPSIYISSTKDNIMYYIQLDEVISICYDNPAYQLTPALEQ